MPINLFAWETLPRNTGNNLTRISLRRFAPYVPSPVIGVVTMMPGLSAEEMELYISKPIEEQMQNVMNLHYIRSTSQDGFSLVALEFHYGVDMKKALFDVQALMNVVQSNLPTTSANLKPSWVVPVDALNLPVLSLSLTGDEDRKSTRLNSSHIQKSRMPSSA